MDRPIVKIGNLWTYFEGLSEEQIEDLYDYFSYEVQNAKFILQNLQMKAEENGTENQAQWDGKKRLFQKGYKRCLSGLSYKACRRLQEVFKVDPVIQMKTDKPPKEFDTKWDYDKFQIRDYQRPVVDAMVKKGRGLLSACTGAGKTLMVAKTIHELGVKPFVFYVLTRDLMRQAKKSLEIAMPNLKVGTVGDGICDLQDVTVMTIQTAFSAFTYDKRVLERLRKEIKEYAELELEELDEIKNEDLEFLTSNRDEIRKFVENVKGIYCDEVHHYAAKTCQEILMKSPKAYIRIGGSATLERADGAYLDIEGLFGRPTAIITASDLIRKNWLLKPNINFINLNAKREICNTFTEDRNLHIVDNCERNDCIIKLAEELKRKKISTMILIQTIKHGKMLQKEIKGSEFVCGSTPRVKRKNLLKEFEEGKFPILIGSIIADEGLDIPSLSALIIAGGGKSPTRAKQRVGRVIRKGSPYAFVWDFMDLGKWTKQHSHARIKILQEEPEFVIKRINAQDVLSTIPGDELF